MSKSYEKISKHISQDANITSEKYEAMYQGSISQPDIFWAVQAKRLDWIKRPTRIKNTSFDGDVTIRWYEDGILNACYNCVDRHLKKRADQTALIFERDEPGRAEHITYTQLHEKVCKLANALVKRGVKKGDRVTIYMPMIPEATYAMLACARIGAIHSVVFGGFSPEALRSRIEDCESETVITADFGLRGGKKIPLKANTNEAIKDLDSVKTVLTFRHVGDDVEMLEGRDIWWHESVDRESDKHTPEEMNAEDPLFILYTSGSTGKPKGVLHTTGGYLVYASLTHEASFDYKDGEVYWCTADVGWITGHSYIVYGPLANGATTLVFEGVPSYPDCSRFWQICETHNVASFYTAPTAIRALLKESTSLVEKHDLSSLRVLGTVGEPINEEAWKWYSDVVGNDNCPIVDTYWQTETGGHIITHLPGAHPLKPSVAGKPFLGVQPVLLDSDGNEIEGDGEGALCIKDSWPGQMRTVYKNHQRFIDTYFSTFKGYYFTGDGARRDDDGDYRITGRVDDVINVSGHRLGTAEIEEAINAHPAVAESAVVGFPHDIKGEAIYAYVILRDGEVLEDTAHDIIRQSVNKIIGPIAKPDIVHVVPGLPKTRSGKIMRRILRKIAANQVDELGDTSTLAEPTIVDKILETKSS